MKINKNIIIGGAIGLSLLISFVLLRKFVFKSDKNKIKDLAGDKTIDITSIQIPDEEKAEFPLKYGSKGNKVKDVQSFLNLKLSAMKKPTVKVDGDWGNSTDTAFKMVNTNVTEVNEGAYKVMKAYLVKNSLLAGGTGGLGKKGMV